MNLLILSEEDRVEDDVYLVLGERAEHIRCVLKLGEGDSIAVGLVDGPQGTARVEVMDEAGVRLRCEGLEMVSCPKPMIDLVCALPRPQTLKKVLLTSAMMGVRALHLIRANRVEKSYFHTPMLEPENYRRHLVEGLSQGKLTRLPQVHVYERFRLFFDEALPAIEESEKAAARKLVAAPAFAETLSDAYQAANGWVICAIGPEGGWVPFEMDLMQEQGFRAFTLGRWVLRVEHAVTATLAQLELLRMERAR